MDFNAEWTFEGGPKWIPRFRLLAAQQRAAKKQEQLEAEE